MGEKKGLLASIFGGKKTGCCCGGCSCGASPQTKKAEAPLNIKVIGSGCTKCVSLAENTEIALHYLGISSAIEKVTDMADIASYGILTTPGLVINDKVVAYGKVLKPEEIIKIIENIR